MAIEPTRECAIEKIRRRLVCVADFTKRGLRAPPQDGLA